MTYYFFLPVAITWVLGMTVARAWYSDALAAARRWTRRGEKKRPDTGVRRRRRRRRLHTRRVSGARETHGAPAAAASAAASAAGGGRRADGTRAISHGAGRRTTDSAPCVCVCRANGPEKRPPRPHRRRRRFAAKPGFCGGRRDASATPRTPGQKRLAPDL